MADTDKAVSDRAEGVNLTPGFLEHPSKAGKAVRLYFQANPPSLRRSRTVGLTKRSGRGKSAYAHQAGDWQIDGLEIALDASRAHWTSLDKQDDQNNVKALVDALDHLEALVDAAPPLVTLTLGKRSWQGYVTSLRIEEKQFTPDLVPTRVLATLGFDVTATLYKPGDLLAPKNAVPVKSRLPRRKRR